MNAYVGGPVVLDKLWYFASVKYTHNTSTQLGARSPRVFDGFNLFGKLTANPFKNHHFMFLVAAGPANISNRRQSFLVDPEAQTHQHQNSLVITAEWQWFVTNWLTAKLHYSHLKTDIDVTPQPCTWRDDLRFKQCEGDQEEGYIDFLTPGHYGSGGARFTENAYYYSINDRERDSVKATLTAYVPRALGTHEIKGGVEAGWVKSDYTFGYTGNLYYVDTLEDSSDPTSTINYYWRETQGQLYQRHTGYSIFAFLQDTWEPLPGLNIDFGVKYDRSVMNNDVGEKIVEYHMVSPVGGISWDPTGRQIAKIYIGGGIVSDAARLGVSSFLDKNGLGRKLYLGPLFDRDTNKSSDQYSYARGQSNYEKFDDLTVPRVYAVAAGFDVQLGGQTSVGVVASAKFFRNLWEDDEVNYIWNNGGTNTIGVLNGLQDYFFRLRTPDDGKRNWMGITFKLQRRMYRRLLLDINYTMSMTRGLTSTQITAALDNPTQRPYEYGWLGSDRPHVVKAAAAYKLPFGLTIGGALSITSGSRFDRQFLSDKGGGSYQNYVAERGTFDSVNPWWSLDLKVRYNLRLPYGKVFATAELHNVTNNRQATGISSGSLNSRGEYFASGRQSPMNLELGLGYEW